MKIAERCVAMQRHCATHCKTRYRDKGR